MSFSAERAADEAAAGATGDRRLTAHAVGHAALAATRTRTGLPSFAPGAACGPVPARVKALLAQTSTGHLVPALLVVALLCGYAGASAVTGRR